MKPASPYHSWSFRDKTFIWAGTLSLLWHAFWFFSVTIVVSPDLKKMKPRPRMVSLGPVLDDSIFRTLIETRPQLSQTFYRPEPDFSSSMEADVETFRGQAPGEVVSVPLSRRFVHSLRELIGGTKTSPDYDFSPLLPISYPGGESLDIQGDVSGRALLSRPAMPRLTVRADEGRRDSETVVAFTVNAAGTVVLAEASSSSGYPDIDEIWTGYVKQFKFESVSGGSQKGRVRLSFGGAE